MKGRPALSARAFPVEVYAVPALSPSQPPDMVGILRVVGRGRGLVPFDRKML